MTLNMKIGTMMTDVTSAAVTAGLMVTSWVIPVGIFPGNFTHARAVEDRAKRQTAPFGDGHGCGVP